MVYLAVLLKLPVYCMCISLLLHTLCYMIIYIACGQEKTEQRKTNKKFYNVLHFQ